MINEILKRLYPPEMVAKMAEVGEYLPTEICPPWYHPLKRRRWIRYMNARILGARIYGWRSNKGNVRSHFYLDKFVTVTK